MTPGTRRALAHCVLAATLAARALAGDETGGTFAESIDVREIEIRFDASVLPPLESLGKRADDDFLVLCDGVELARTPAPAAPAGEQTPLARSLWFDPAFASSSALAATARLLADAAPALATGKVELVVARPFRRQEFRAGAAEPLAAELRRLAREWEESETPTAPGVERERALDRLALDRFERRVPAGALFVAVDGVEIDAAGLNELARLARGGATDGSPLAPLEQVARLLAASGWTTFAVAARALPDSARDLRSARDAERREVGGKPEWVGPILRFPWRKPVPSARASVALDVALDLTLEPWSHLVNAGSGALIAEAGMVGVDLARVAGRRRLIVRPPEQAPGVLHRLEVRWSGGDGRRLPSPRWLRAGAPPELTAVRLRSLAAHDLEAAPETSARFEPGADGAEPTRVCLPGNGSSRWLRLSSLDSATEPAKAAIGPALPLATGEAPCAALCRPESEGAPCARTDGPGALVLIEDLDSGAWAAVELPEP